MRIISIILFTLITNFSSIGAAFSLEDMIGVADVKTVEEENSLPPDPMELEPNWWQYFSGSVDDLKKKIPDVEERYQKLIGQAPEDDKEEVKEYVQRILINLKALLNARAQTVQPFVTTPLKDEYTFDEILNIAAKKKSLESQLRDEKKELALTQDRGKKVLQHIDTLYVTYMGMREQNTAKELVGLEIISLRMALALADESSRVSRLKAEQMKSEIAQLDTQLAAGFKKLSVSNIDEAAFQRDIHRAQNELKRTQAAAVVSEMNSLGTFEDSATDRSKSFFFTQKAVLDRSKEAQAKAELIFIEAKRSLIELAAGEEPDYEGLNEDIADWQDQTDDLQSMIPDWESKTMQEYERSLKPLDPDSGKALEALQQQRVQAVQETLKVLNQLKLKLNFDELIIGDLKDRISLQQGVGALWFYSALEWLEGCCNPVVAWLYAPLIKVGGVPITVMSLLRIIIIIGLTFAISALLRRFLRKMNSSKIHMTDSSIFLVDKVIHYLVLCIGFAVTLASVGLSLSNLAIVLGALSVGIGFGLQTIVNNFLSSLIIMFSRTMKVGDIVELADGKYGQVTAINIQNSIIHTNDGIDVIIPNSEILSGRLTNWTLNDNFRRLHIPFSVAYGTDKELVVQAACEAADKVPCTVKNSSHLSDPQVWLINFGESSLDFELIVWVNAYGYGHRGSMKASYFWELENALRKYKIEVPFPQREVRVIAETGDGKVPSSALASVN